MALEFTLASEVTPGDPLSSCHLYRFSRAFNTRLPYFDFAWRIAFYALGLFRSVRNGSADGSLQAPWAEYFFSYQGLEPGQGDWPLAEPGEPEGANLSNPVNGYIWGNPAMYSESVRLAEVPLEVGTPPHAPATPQETWALRKAQCGAVELSTGRQDAPAWQAARSWFEGYQGPRSPHGNAYGGFIASPAPIGLCQDPDLYDGIPAPYSYEVKFAATAEGIAAGYVDRAYPGTCPVGPATTEDYSDHVNLIVRSPWAFYVQLNSGAVDVLPRYAYTEGPYSGPGVLRKTDGQQLTRAVQAFTAAQRGIAQNDAARSCTETGAATQPTTWLDGSFAAEDFLTRQYVLAPLRGQWTGSAVEPVIPTGTLTAGSDGTIAAGTILTHTVNAECVVSYGYAVVTGLLSGQSAAVRFGGTLVTLTPDAPAAVVALTIAAGASITVSLEASVATDATGNTLVVELTEAVLYKPDLSDLLLVHRITGDPDSGLSLNCATWDADLRARGCILNRNGQDSVQTPVAAITEHPMYDPIRRWSRFVRMLPASAVVGYAVEAGKSIVWFRRYAAWTGRPPTRTEIVQGTSGIKPGLEYVVETTGTGAVIYGPDVMKEFVTGDHFVGLNGYADYDTNLQGTATVFELAPGAIDPLQAGDLWGGIAEQVTRTAPPGGVTNRWICGFNFKAQHPSESSEWKPSAYGDIFALNDRATFYSPEIAQEHDKRLAYHVAYGEVVPGPAGGNIISESPTGYRYQPVTSVGGSWYWLNNPQVGQAFFPTDFERTSFFKSCRIYEPELEIESAEAVTEGSDQLVKVTFMGRLHNTNGQLNADGDPVGAPDEIARDVATWDLDALQAEPYQTTERALRCHIARTQTARNFTATYGDHAALSSLGYDPAYPYASDWPITYLVRMMPEPVADGNETQEPTDTPVWHDAMIQAETYLRAMAEACVDPDQSVAELQAAVDAAGGAWQDIPRWSIHDYSYDRLCAVAFAGSWPGLMPTVATTETPESYVRPDNPHGHGPVPQTRVCAEQFNRLAKMVNRLNRFRVMLPFTMERYRRYLAGERLAPECPYLINYPTGQTYGSLEGITAYPTIDRETGVEDWIEADSAESTAQATLDLMEDPPGSGTYAWAVVGSAMEDQFRVTLTPGIENALPGYLRELVDLSGAQVIGWSNETKLTHTRTETTSGDPNGWRDPVDGKYYLWLEGPTNENRWFAEFRTVGTATAPSLPAPTDAAYRNGFTGVNGSAGGAFTTYAIGFLPGDTLSVTVPVVALECPDDGYSTRIPTGLPVPRGVYQVLGPPTPAVRLAILAPCCYLGGAERWMMDLLDVLPRTIECVGVSVIYPETSSPAAIAELRKRASVTGFGVRPARDLVRRANVVISWGMMPLAECLDDYRGRRVTVIHGSDVDYSRHVVNQALAVGAELVAVSEACLLPCGDHPARVLRSGISPDRLHCLERDGDALRESLGILADEMVVGFVGRLSQEKRIERLIAAVPHLPPNYRVLIVGDGFDTERLKAEAAPLGERVIFLPGRLDIAPVYAALDLFWCGSPSEGLPYTIMEAALAGIPLVSTRLGVLHEIAARHGTLWTELPPDPTPRQIALALEGAPVSCNDLRDVILDEYGLEAMGRRWTAFLLGA